MTGSFGGATFTLSGPTATNTGTWDLSWEGLTEDLIIDLAVVVKASDRFATYVFENELFAAPSGGPDEGTYEITFLNNGGNIPDLSHLSIYARDAEGGIPPEVVPIPAAAWLFGSALLGFIGYARRRQA